MRTNLGGTGNDEKKYRGTPKACVARMINTACNDGRLLRSHLIVGQPFVCPSLLLGIATSTHPACTHDLKPLNRITVLMTTALGR